MVSCVVGSAGTLVTGSEYTMVVKDDMGTASDTSDDQVLGTYQHTIETTVALPERLNRRKLTFNGATTSMTEAGNFIPVSGFINPDQDVTVTYPTVSGAQEYMLMMLPFDESSYTIEDVNYERRIFSSTGTMTIPAGVLEQSMAARVRVRAGSNANVISTWNTLSTSRYLVLTPGLNGMVNLEFAVPTNLANTLTAQLYFTTDSDGNLSCSSITDGSASEYVRCASSGNSIDYANNRVTLKLETDMLGSSDATVTATLNFTNANIATMSVSDSTGEILVGKARVVTTELTAHTRIFPDATERTHIVYRNPIPGYSNGVMSSPDGLLLNGSASSLLLWDDAISGGGFEDTVRSFQVRTPDQTIVQPTGSFYINKGGKEVLSNGTYQVVQSDTGGMRSRKFKASYVYHDPAVMRMPSNVVLNVNDVAASTTWDQANVSNHTTVSDGDTFSVSWTWNSSDASLDPTTILWQVQVSDPTGTSGRDNRTSYLLPAAGTELTYDSNSSTWTWTNQGYNMQKDGEVNQIFVRPLISVNGASIKSPATTGVTDMIQGQSAKVYVYFPAP